ncbi:hypothetical protein [Streptomyces sp. NBC_00576]|uniref:hypothetical protein n=1 Tax=Streptomyces sp. NBC_00576 TaxID=2903665 RepID=UPI002E803D5F|nr:hypothetical protein [Streptomyces sp. NBC_00576]WUB71938.1 hypothetical protein OG734_18545 [Streptomyces sp. NBC_00576]
MGMKDEMQDKARQAKEKMEQTRKGQRQTGQPGQPGQAGQQGRRRPGQEETPERGRSRDEDTQRAMRDEEDRLNQDYDI